MLHFNVGLDGLDFALVIDKGCFNWHGFQSKKIVAFLFLHSEQGEKYALRLANFVQKRLKSEATASVILNLPSRSPACHCRSWILHAPVVFFATTIGPSFVFVIIILFSIPAASGSTQAFTMNFGAWLPDLDKYFAEDFTHSTPHCWFSKGVM